MESGELIASSFTTHLSCARAFVTALEPFDSKKYFRCYQANRLGKSLIYHMSSIIRDNGFSLPHTFLSYWHVYDDKLSIFAVNIHDT